MHAFVDKKKKRINAWYFYLPMIVAVVSFWFGRFSPLRMSTQVEETVAIDSSRHSVTPSSAPVAKTSELPHQDRDVEAIGDHIAETILYLKKRQTAAALRSLRQAQLSTNHALAVRANNGVGEKELSTTLGEIETVEHTIQHGLLDDASRQLNALERKLDALAR